MMTQGRALRVVPLLFSCCAGTSAVLGRKKGGESRWLRLRCLALLYALSET